MLRVHLEEIGRKFGLEGELYEYDEIAQGRINDTYRVIYKSCVKSADLETETKKYKMDTYVFQRVNTYVFKKPEEVMHNIARICRHIEERSLDGEPVRVFYCAKDGNTYVYDEENAFWRVSNYIEGVAIDRTDNLDIVRSTGKAFGRFQVRLADFDAESLFETIPDFHNTRKRCADLFELYTSLNDKPASQSALRAENVKEEIEFLSSVKDKALLPCDAYFAGKMPTRVSHNDTKANNVIFDYESSEPLMVIDLDTVMPGMAVYDFGDGVRFICNAAGRDDENDLDKVTLDMEKFLAYAEGFFGETAEILSDNEISLMVNGVFSIMIELGVRFLTDYLSGDVYFKTNYEEHNLVRARCQFKLAKEVMNNEKLLNEIVSNIIKKNRG